VEVTAFSRQVLTSVELKAILFKLKEQAENKPAGTGV
jgi:hypothetical protein